MTVVLVSSLWQGSRADKSSSEVDEVDDIVVGVLDLSGLSTEEFNAQTKGSNWFIKFYG